MAACGPFEAKPHVAVGVSGGSDSMALMLLLADWVRGQGGKLTALTVDHGLRPEAANEARTVAGWAAKAGIDHRTLAWTGIKPGTAVQAAAREARYELMGAWCRENEVLHLATAHQQDDQRETVAMRRARGGPDQFGSAGISSVSTRRGVRLLRPLLPVTGATLKSYLQSRHQCWLEDPSNRHEHYERIRWRRGIEGPLPTNGEILAWGEARREAEREVAGLLARSVSVHAAGFALIDVAAWAGSNPAILHRALGQVVATIAGRDYLPARAPLDRAVQKLLAGQCGLSLGGTLISIWRGQGLICREAAAVTDSMAIVGPQQFIWDRRFLMTISGDRPAGRIEVLGERGVAEIGQTGHFRANPMDIPALVRPSLAAIWAATGRLSAVPHLGFDPYGEGLRAQFRFRPHYSVTSSGFTVAYGWPHTI
ncbi:MAG: tRNA lysidine(34) synthetase TilS [Rhodospirillaceae bacterium]|nr:tRNA lysidine(34) synthetase TilS [Rhodospirillaceae bacterium]